MGSSISYEFNGSRVLNKIMYHDGMLEVHFNSGAVWRYAGVPTSVVVQLVAATSAGSFFCRNIRGKYTSICVVNAKGEDMGEDMGEVCPRAEKQTPVIVLKLKLGELLPASHSFSGIVEYANGTKEWYKDGKIHREDGPAIERSDGTKEWYKDGEFHREDGPAIERSDGSKFWLVEGKFHRDDGPACEWFKGTKEWWKDGKPHREDGPAIERSDGIKGWYLNGIEFSSETEWKAELKKLRGESQAEKQTPAILLTRSVLHLKEGQEVPAGYTGLVQWKNGVSASYTNGVGEIV